MPHTRARLSIRAALLGAVAFGLGLPLMLERLLAPVVAAELHPLPSLVAGADAGIAALPHWPLWLAQLLCTAAAVSAVWYLRLARPMARLAAQAESMAARAPAEAPAWQADDDIGALGLRLVDARARIEALFDELERKNAQLRRMAMYDHLSGLPNRTLFRELFAHEAGQSRRSGRALALLSIDLDRFRAVNDGLGHAAGDALLLATGRRLVRTVSASDVLCRYGGDEFLVLLHDAGRWENVAAAAQALLAAIEQPLRLEAQPAEDLLISAHIGIAMFPADGSDFEPLVRHADLARQHTRREGRARFGFYHAALNAQWDSRAGLERELARAIVNGELVLHYQPVVDAASGLLRGCEALVRWQHPQRGLLLPHSFIAVAEASGLVRELGLWTLGAACAQMARWRALGLAAGRVSINVSALQFRDERLIDTLDDQLREHGVRPDELELELTESTLMGDDAITGRIVGMLRERGIALTVDDFGTGFSSLSYLKRLRPDKLKIDRSFVQDLPDDTDDGALTQAILSMARALGITVVAEGVETARQRSFLAQRGCALLQGFLLGEPMPAAEFAERIRERDQGLVSAPSLTAP